MSRERNRGRTRERSWGRSRGRPRERSWERSRVSRPHRSERGRGRESSWERARERHHRWIATGNGKWRATLPHRNAEKVGSWTRVEEKKLGASATAGSASQPSKQHVVDAPESGHQRRLGLGAIGKPGCSDRAPPVSDNVPADGPLKPACPTKKVADSSCQFGFVRSRRSASRVSWAECHGALLCNSQTQVGGPSSPITLRGLINLPRTRAFTQQAVKNHLGAPNPPVKSGPLSYKDALLMSAPPSKPPEGLQPRRPLRHSVPFRLSSKRCFRCLATDHLIRSCRDPVRCAACFRTGHRARLCPLRSQKTKMQRSRGLRPDVSKVFIPLTEEFRNRQSQCRNAVLADVIGRANMGHFPQDTLAADLAARYGGFPTDFLVARHQERDYVILLPE